MVSAHFDFGPLPNDKKIVRAKELETLKQFKRTIRNDTSGWNFVVRRADELGLLGCHKCGAYQPIRKNLRVITCGNCGAERSVTSGTRLERVRKIVPWLLAMWFLEHGVILSSVRLQEFAKVAQSTALNIQRKVRFVVESKMDETAQSLLSSVFSPVMNRRSLETPAREHPRVEERERQNQEIEETSDLDSADEDSAVVHPPARSVSDDDSFAGAALNGVLKVIFECLADGPKSFDDLVLITNSSSDELSMNLTLLETEGLIVHLGGGRYSRSAATEKSGKPVSKLYEAVAVSPETKAFEKLLREFVVDKFNSVSRKYLQLYMSDFWCQWDRVNWFASSLVTECLLSQPLPYKQMLQFVSDLIIRVPKGDLEEGEVSSVLPGIGFG